LKHAFFALNSGMRQDLLRMIFEIRALTIGGFRINLDRCCKCARPYTGAGRAVFRPEKGGIACLNCEMESRSSPGIGPDGIKEMMKIQSRPWDGTVAEGVSEAAFREIRQVLKLHMDFRVGQNLKSAVYLE